MLTVHHLAFSRSTRVIWLLEELGVPYRLIRYDRTAEFRAPPALSAVHPLGKAPVIVDDELVLGESAVILTYIDTRYGEGRFAPPPGSEDHWRHEEWLQFVESTAALPILMTRIGAMAGGLPDRAAAFIATTLRKVLDAITTQLDEGPFLLGRPFTLADIQMSYVLEVARDTGLLAPYPAVADYLERLKTRPAYGKAIEVGGPMMPPKS